MATAIIPGTTRRTVLPRTIRPPGAVRRTLDSSSLTGDTDNKIQVRGGLL